MFDFGNTDGHSNIVQIPDNNELDARNWIVHFVHFELNAVVGAQRWWAGKATTAAPTNGHLSWINASELFGIRNRTGGSGGDSAAHTSTAFTVDSTPHMTGYLWRDSGNILRGYYDGLVENTAVSYSTNFGANSDVFRWGSVGASLGPACKIGQIMIWAGDTSNLPSDSEVDSWAAQYYAGDVIPRPDLLKVWIKGDTVSGVVNQIDNATVTVGGGVSAHADPIDSYFSTQLEPARTIASHRLWRQRSEVPLYTLVVPLDFLNLELMDLFNLSHDSYPQSATRLTDLELLDKWRRGIVRLVGHEFRPLERQVVLSFVPHRGVTYWSTDEYPHGTNDNKDGLARLGNGGDLSVSRGSFAYLPQPNITKIEVTQDTEGRFLKSVAVGQEKINHQGMLTEEAADQPILNSAFDALTAWTQNANGGTIDGASTLRLAYPSEVTDRSLRVARTDNSNDTYVTQAFAVLTADTERRIMITKTEEDDATILSWRLQRDTDSAYWDGSAWTTATGDHWATLSNSYNSGTSLPEFEQVWSAPIPIDQNENWTVDVGLHTAHISTGGGEGNFYAVEAQKGKFRLTSIPSDSSAASSQADECKRIRTSLPQIVSALRGSLTFEVYAFQDGDDLEDGDEMVLFYWQYGSTAAQDFDVVKYQKLSGLNVRFVYERYFSGARDGRARRVYNMTPGETIRVACVWTDDTNGELGESNSLLRIYVNDNVGTDDNSSGGNHSSSEAHTELWFGSAPSSLGWLRSSNYVSHPKFWTYPLTAEEIP